MAMYKEVGAELRNLRAEKKNEPDEDVKAQLTEQIEGLRKKQNKWGKLLEFIE